jgi:hypothetical protein
VEHRLRSPRSGSDRPGTFRAYLGGPFSSEAV